jgi:hypothetical protein
MSYGIEIQNADGRIVIDSSYVNLGLISNTVSTATKGSAYPGLGGTTASDLIFARAETNSNGIVGKYLTEWAQNMNVGIPNLVIANTFIYYAVRSNSSLLSPGSTGYGFEVYNESGNVAFSSNITKNFEIVVAGVFNAAAANAPSITFPSSSTTYSNLDKYYCVVDNTSVVEDAREDRFGNLTTQAYRIGYTYQWLGSNTGRITVNNSLFFSGTFNLNFDFHYMIVKEIP